MAIREGVSSGWMRSMTTAQALERRLERSNGASSGSVPLHGTAEP
jgi:hypothetical protein